MKLWKADAFLRQHQRYENLCIRCGVMPKAVGITSEEQVLLDMGPREPCRNQVGEGHVAIFGQVCERLCQMIRRHLWKGVDQRLLVERCRQSVDGA